MIKNKVLYLIIVVVTILLGIILFVNKNSSETYIVITDYKYTTMMNDGGSHYNIYYSISNNIVKKYEDHYVGFKRYEYQDKLIYEKTISGEAKELNSLLEELIGKEDINDNSNYSPYVIKYDGKEKDIYNLDSINKLKSILKKIDDK